MVHLSKVRLPLSHADMLIVPDSLAPSLAWAEAHPVARRKHCLLKSMHDVAVTL